MKYETVVAASALLGFAAASPYHTHHSHVRRVVTKREVPQEQSHNVFLGITREFLQKNNPKNIVDPVFGLLGDDAAAKGAGSVTNLACLHQETADQAFTNAKAEKDIRGMSAALVYQAVERNSKGIGATSAACTEKAVNPEIAALQQHQDPAGADAAATNKAITLELAKQLASIGGDPMLALESGTFAPGDKNDNTLAGNTCDDANDQVGCIFTQRKLVLDATPDEITAAVAGIKSTITGGTGELKANHIDFTGLPVAGKSASVSNSTANSNSAATNPAASTGSDKNCVARAVADVQSSNGTAAAADGNGSNVQTFTGDLGGLPPPVTQGTGDRPFSVNGVSFVGKGAALGRSCDIQHNKCANAVNSGEISGSASQCDDQDNQCRTQANLRRRFLLLDARAADFGTCSDPTISFSSNLSDRQGSAFIANNQKDFNHGSAQKIGIIASFICQRLQEACKAPAATVSQCQSAQQAATAATQDQTAADVFNSKLTGGSGAANGNANNGNANNGNATARAI